MTITLFPDYVAKYFGRLIGKLTERFNDVSSTPNLLHKSMLDQEYTADLNWGSSSINHSIVAADVVALDSSLPLKKRGVINIATGTVPKLGVKYRKGEKLITEINTLIARGIDESTVANKIFDDAKRVVDAIDVRNEIMFEQALSTGAILIKDGSDSGKLNDGTGIRASFGYLSKNEFPTTLAPWSAPFAKPLDDLRQLFNEAEADGNSINHLWMSLSYFNKLRSSNQGKELAATYLNQVITANTVLPVPSRSTFIEALGDEFGATVHIVNSTFRIEKPDGTYASVHPWEEANVVGTAEEKVGRLVYGTLAEETNPVNQVTYAKVGNYVLVSKFSKTDPLEEFTAGQALCIPVIDNADSIYLLEADEVADDVLVAKGGDISDGKISAAKTSSTKTFTVEYKGDATNLSVSSEQAWLTPTLSSGTVSISVSANSASSAPARTGSVVVTDGYTSVSVTVEQAANS